MKIISLFICLLMAGTVGYAKDNSKSSTTRMPSQNQKSDADIAQMISEKLFFDRFFDPKILKVEVHDGVAILSGQLRDLRSKDRALNTLSEVPGVRSIVDQTKLVVPNRKDADIANDIKRAFTLDVATEAWEIKPEVSNGVVTLTGNVKSWVEKDAASWVAKGVTGVKEIKNLLKVANNKTRPEKQVVADIRERLKMDPWVQGQLITIGMKNKKVTMSGYVGTLAAKRRAFDAAWVSGVDNVDVSQLKVDPTLKIASEKQSYKPPTDQQMKKAVDDSLLWDPRVNSLLLTTKVEGHEAFLSGTVDNLKAKKAAESDAKNTMGIFSVKNDIQVQPPKKTDAEIKTDVAQMLKMDPLVDRYEITIDVKNGLVTLSGSTNSYYEKYYAEDDASRVKGVKDVINNIQVNFQLNRQAKSDKQLQEEIARDLRLKMNLDNDENIKVSAKNGSVELNGKVDTWVENMISVNTAFEAGAKSVINNLHSPGNQLGPIVSFTAAPYDSYTLYWIDSYPITYKTSSSANSSNPIKSGTTQDLK